VVGAYPSVVGNGCGWGMDVLGGGNVEGRLGVRCFPKRPIGIGIQRLHACRCVFVFLHVEGITCKGWMHNVIGQVVVVLLKRMRRRCNHG
jgi:hypothetical protein